MVQFHLRLPGVFYTRLYLEHKQESSGVATLEVDGCYMEDSKSKAEALNKQFQSVFTDEDMSTLPQMGTSKTQDNMLHYLAWHRCQRDWPIVDRI
jgi:hypothetical protein